MKRFSKYVLVVGAILTMISLLLGFGGMFTDHDDLAVTFLTLVPVGFLMTFSGFMVWILHGGD